MNVGEGQRRQNIIIAGSLGSPLPTVEGTQALASKNLQSSISVFLTAWHLAPPLPTSGTSGALLL